MAIQFSGPLEGQIKQAAFARELRMKIPNQLRSFIDIRPTQKALTVVSLFPYAPMRGIPNLSAVAVGSLLEKLAAAATDLLSPDKSDVAKVAVLGSLGFKSRKHRMTQEPVSYATHYVEEDVQAYLIRELLGNAESPFARQFRSVMGAPIRYLCCELEWSWEGSALRPDVICHDTENPARVLIVELKARRTTKLGQVVEYRGFLNRYGEELRRFISALSGVEVQRVLEVHTAFLMAHHPNSPEDWAGHERNAGTRILFYQAGITDFSPWGEV